MSKRLGFIYTVLVVLLVIGLATAAYAVLRERTTHYWAYTYGDGIPAFQPGTGCTCVVGPCPGFYEIVGERTFNCDGTTTEWGYVDHPCTDKTYTSGSWCYQ